MRKASLALALIPFALVGCGPAPATPQTTPTSSAPSPTPSVQTAPAGRVPPAGLIAFAVKSGRSAAIYTVKSDGTDRKQLTNSTAFDGCPDWSPNGKTIAFCSDRSGFLEIWLMDSSGQHARQLTTLKGRNTTYPDISPDGQRIAFCAERAG